MKSIFFLSFNTLLLGSVCCCSQSTPTVSIPTVQEYYPLQSGTHLWIYTKNTFTPTGSILTSVSDTLFVVSEQYKGHDAFKFLNIRDSTPIVIQYYSENEVMNVDLKSTDTAAHIFFIYPLKVGEKFIVSSDTNLSGDVHLVQLSHLNDPSSKYLPPGYDRAFDVYNQISLEGKVGGVLDTVNVNVEQFYPDEGLDGSTVTTFSSNGNFRSSFFSFTILR